MTLPILALTLGDPAGIGPEIVARTLADPAPDITAHGVAVGDATALRRGVAACGLDVKVRVVDRFTDGQPAPGVIDCFDLGRTGPNLAWGRIQPEAGRSAVAAVEAAVEAALEGTVAGIVTAPINKEAMWAAGVAHPGHTELLGALTGSEQSTTMFVVRGLKIFFTTRHVSLRAALDGTTRETVRRAIDASWTALWVVGHDEPRLAVAALNPHGGEHGAFGREEIDHIAPACEDARREGQPVDGPIPADAVFHHGLQGRYDGVLSHFHDQGHIAAKTVDFQGAITVTMGLPILRTSVDHGTAFDIAGTGTADHRGMEAAFRTAAAYTVHVPRMREAYGATGDRR